jgi:hypothetical protein
MTDIITLEDLGQDYVTFNIDCGVIDDVTPSLLGGWKGTKVLNTEFVIGEKLKIDLQWRDINPTLEQPIVSISYKDVPGSEWLRENMSVEKKLYACPRGGDERMMYEVGFEGMPFYFECVNKAAVAASDAFRNIEKIPAVLLEDVDGIMLFSEIKPGSPITIADIGGFFMVIYNNNIVDYGIITHEATHAWAQDKWGGPTPPNDTDYVEVIRFSEEDPITEYAKTNYAEDLAEGVRYYVFDPPWMKVTCPLRYAIIEKMMTDPNYYG